MIDVTTLEYDFDEEALGFEEPQPSPELEPHKRSAGELIGTGLLAIGSLGLLLALFGGLWRGSWAGLGASFGLLIVGAITLWAGQFGSTTPGIKHDGTFFRGVQNRGLLGWALGVFITGFYVVLYFYEDWRGLGLPALLEAPKELVNPLALALSGKPADRWFVYGFMYTVAVLTFGVRMFFKYRHNRYQLVRTGSVMFFQLGFAFLIPNLLKLFNKPEFYFSYFWPLKREYLFPGDLQTLSQTGALGQFMVFWTVLLAFVGVPVLTYYVGKRWYCSWVCGCGGLAETLGDPWRQQSSKSSTAWKIERWMIHSVLIFVTLVTGLLWINSARQGQFLGEWSSPFAKFYGFAIGAVFSGVVGVGFYPILGSRVWCRFGCPQAAILGLFQRFFSRFRITTNGDQCMSCGNCSTYCEMGIDVRAYAQRGESIVRASCVGCGVCAAACPRGVLKLENGPTHKDRFSGAETPAAKFLEDLTTAPRQGHN